MAARRPKLPRARPSVVAGGVSDAATSRVLDGLATAVSKLQAGPDFGYFETDLEVGTNVIEHGLGRRPRFVGVTPTVADASYAWALNTTDNPHPERQVLIDVIGVAQPGALVLVS